VGESRSNYEGRSVALVTLHDKQRVMAPLLSEDLGMDLVAIHDIDTDALGTFTRDIPRAGSQLESARRKARLAIERGHELGLGSEGAFLPGPFGIGAFNLELVVFIDAETGLEVVGRATESGRHIHGLAATEDELAELGRLAGFPGHGLVLRPDDEHHPKLWKGLRTENDLHEAFAAVKRESHGGRVFIENDLRAHMNPTRMRTIASTTSGLVARLKTHCSACDSPNFGLERAVPGLPCR
jgi:hypothetical protein